MCKQTAVSAALENTGAGIWNKKINKIKDYFSKYIKKKKKKK